MYPIEKDNDLNFWPSFADTMLSFVLVFVIILGVVAIVNRENAISLGIAYKNQENFVSQVAERTGFSYPEHGFGRGGVVCLGHDDGGSQNGCILSADRDLHLLTLRFSNQVLFASDEYRLTPQGALIIEQVGSVLKTEACKLYRIQIEGHTDLLPTANYAYGNLELGAMRSIAVYSHLTQQVGLDPVRNLMSVTSYGEYKPTSRMERGAFTLEELVGANASLSERSINRRIEIQLFYRTQESGCTEEVTN